jgi:dCMP deaminase
MNSTTRGRGDSDDEADDDDWLMNFESPSEMLDFATLNWRKHLVTTALPSFGDDLALFTKRPFFLLIRMDAPIMVRWARAKARCACLENPTLDQT